MLYSGKLLLYLAEKAFNRKRSSLFSGNISDEEESVLSVTPVNIHHKVLFLVLSIFQRKNIHEDIHYDQGMAKTLFQQLCLQHS